VVGYRFVDGNTTPWRKSKYAEGVEVKDLGTADGRAMKSAQRRYRRRSDPRVAPRLGEHFFIIVTHFIARLDSPEAKEGFSAFLEKRRPGFSKFA
jgi:enoyl-CoA hydratase/carnithine racemase